MNKEQIMLFNLQRFCILSLFTNSLTERKVSPAYAYAWHEGAYPILHESAIWHQPFEPYFAVRCSEMEELYKYLSECSDHNHPVTFYDLEQRYEKLSDGHPGPVWGRTRLVNACRYFHLWGCFDRAFWETLVSSGGCPMEARTVLDNFEAQDVYFE